MVGNVHIFIWFLFLLSHSYKSDFVILIYTELISSYFIIIYYSSFSSSVAFYALAKIWKKNLINQELYILLFNGILKDIGYGISV